ncbi:thioredoxin-like domain-containing protein [Streptomyces sp. NBC_00825]|uniref:NHL domain-containing thioredoxin family protein n=1 Tax=unclassified Streptomyces TaxID=2593676 RepID=UPI0022526F11|nr:MULTISPECIES: NHL domain-containing thioredoxin family protein [unclassified Streptomyces]WTB55368.1 thioredoxin-like domain-containing protein [Streptomyces sp. NBC_00826]WTH91750.1 thioredoxin-like domain-containing protein [Streptomyces sp. NBC_00825]WTI00478.1 thioredoxin-like domain-containing protein [Streptomyces sp. NBC_00822]MCX4865978.1 thioredoxin-like domain-containing protein [Streptomyces sp. NBC_00906]MCX4897217.1 thioredoxin-like domain-containing protein [Streptomyces sp. N
MATRARVRAPELVGKGGWLNTGDQQYTLADLRGRIVVLDFWTFCCVNCLHVLDELRELEEKHRDTLVIIGVHSPKFVHEAEHQAVVDAVERYEVHHPVLDDPELATWKQYAVRAWPTLVVIDPEGYVVAQHAGEGHAHAIAKLVEELEAEHAAKGTLRRGDGPYVAPEPVATHLRFPGKALLLPDGGFLVSDTTRHRLVEIESDGETVRRHIGAGERGFGDGGPEEARFSEPQGLAVLPDGRIAVADTVNHAIRAFDPATGETTTLAGTGRQWWQGSPTSGPAREVDLSSPWDVAWFADRLWIAMAGVHQLWTYDPATQTVRVAAGTTNEGLVDGPADEAWFAQPSGLATSADGERLWVADSETSAVRHVEREGDGFAVRTAVGTGLFDFGHRDGAAGQALFQHPLGVTALPDGSVAVCDTYNHALRRYDPASGEVTTLATDLREPSDAVLVDGDLVVVESARHRLTRLRLPEEAVHVTDRAHRTQRAATEIAPGTLRLDVVFQAPAGQKLDTRYGPSTRLLVSATPPELLAEGAGPGTDLFRDLVLADDVTEGVLHVSAMAASCDDDPANEYPACHVHQQDWGVPVRVSAGGASRLPLVLAGMDEQG